VCPRDPGKICYTFAPTPPVRCGPDDCEYPNLCTATNLGFDVAECSEYDPNCPGRPSGLCRAPYAPVTCGILNCQYDNVCEAIRSGEFAPDDCCRVPLDPEQECSAEEYAPVLCGDGDCGYATLCSATKAGFRTGDCRPKSEADASFEGNGLPTDDPAGGESNDDPTRPSPDEEPCPDTEDGIFCFELYEPVTCGDRNCSYTNACFASGAGFDAGSQCSKVEAP